MFEGFANVWTPVVLSRTLKTKPLPVTLAGERLVFFRDAKGEPKALLDQCPHRGVALSLGTVRDGCIECPFHAWRFDGAGACVKVPLNPDAKRDRLFAQAIPVRERGGVIWAYTAPVDVAPCEPTVPEALLMEGVARTGFEVVWNAHWTRAMENMLDAPHIPFVHATTIGRFVRPKMRDDSTMHIEWRDTATGGETESRLDDQRDSGGMLTFTRPNMMTLHIPIPGKVFRMHSFCVPIDATHVRMIIVGIRSFATWRGLNWFFNRSNMKVAAQDKAVVESSFPVEIPPAVQELSVRTDKATLQFRKYYFGELKPSSAPPRSRFPHVVRDAS